MANKLSLHSKGSQYQKVNDHGVVDENELKYNMKYNSNDKVIDISVDTNNNGVKNKQYIKLNDNDIQDLFNQDRNQNKSLESALHKLLPARVSNISKMEKPKKKNEKGHR